MIILTLVRILLISLITCKHYLVEVEDAERKVLDGSEVPEKSSSDYSKDPEKKGSDYSLDQPRRECGPPMKTTSRIVNGQDADKNEFPWQVLISSDHEICGGTILTKNKILTAAHCTIKHQVEKILVYPGKHDNKLTSMHYNVCKKIEHPGYNNKTDPVYDLDIAILHLCESSELEFSDGKFYP